MLHRNRNPIKAGVLASVTALAGMLGTTSGAIAQETAPEAKPSAEPKIKELIDLPRGGPHAGLALPAAAVGIGADSRRRGPDLPAAGGTSWWKRPGVKSSRSRTSWLEMPFDQFPVAEARKFVDRWGDRLQQMEFGARRQTCNWNYTLPEQKERAIEILLPDAQELRSWARLLARQGAGGDRRAQERRRHPHPRNGIGLQPAPRRGTIPDQSAGRHRLRQPDARSRRGAGLPARRPEPVLGADRPAPPADRRPSGDGDRAEDGRVDASPRSRSWTGPAPRRSGRRSWSASTPG